MRYNCFMWNSSKQHIPKKNITWACWSPSRTVSWLFHVKFKINCCKIYNLFYFWAALYLPTLYLWGYLFKEWIAAWNAILFMLLLVVSILFVLYYLFSLCHCQFVILFFIFRLRRSIRSMLQVFLVFHNQKSFARLSVLVVDLVEKKPDQQYLLLQHLYPLSVWEGQ